MEYLHANLSVSITELKRSPSAVLQQANCEPVAVLNHNKPAGYLIAPQVYEAMLSLLEVGGLREAIAVGRSDPRPAVAADALFEMLENNIATIENTHPSV